MINIYEGFPNILFYLILNFHGNLSSRWSLNKIAINKLLLFLEGGELNKCKMVTNQYNNPPLQYITIHSK